MDGCRCCRWIRSGVVAALIIFACSSANAYDSASENRGSHSTNQLANFVAWIVPKIQTIMSEKSGIVAEKFPIEIAVAQAALETDWGRHKPALKRKNFFGLTRKDGTYMRFESAEDSIRTYVKSLSGNRTYSDLRKKLEITDHPEKLAEELDGYAEDENYVPKLKSIIRSIRKLLPEGINNPSEELRVSQKEDRLDQSHRIPEESPSLRLRFDVSLPTF